MNVCDVCGHIGMSDCSCPEPRKGEILFFDTGERRGIEFYPTGERITITTRDPKILGRITGVSDE